MEWQLLLLYRFRLRRLTQRRRVLLVLGPTILLRQHIEMLGRSPA